MFDNNKTSQIILIISGVLISFLFSAENNNKVIRSEDLKIKRIIPVEIEKENFGLLGKDYAVSKGNTLEIKSSDGQTKEIIQLVRPSFFGRDDKISPSGDKVASLTMDKESKTTHIVVNGVGQDGNQNTVDFIDKSEIEESWYSTWSPNSEYMTFFGRTDRLDNKECNLYLLKIDSDEIIEIAKFPIGEIKFTSDSIYVFYRAKMKKGREIKRTGNVFRYDIEYRITTQITDNTYTNGLYPSPDGSKVIFSVIDPISGIGDNIEIIENEISNDKKGSLLIVDIEKEEYRELYSINTIWGAHAAGESTIYWSPDGSKFAFCKIEEMIRGAHSEFVISKSEIIGSVQFFV